MAANSGKNGPELSALHALLGAIAWVEKAFDSEEVTAKERGNALENLFDVASLIQSKYDLNTCPQCRLVGQEACWVHGKDFK